MEDIISIIVPVYNVAEYLPRCLDSILAQTYPNIEIIAVDDDSCDDSGIILDDYAEKWPNLKVIHQENSGVTSARMRGVSEASGKWIGFVDSDDEIEPDMYERLLTNAKRHNVDISHCGYQMIFQDGRTHYFHNTGIIEVMDRLQSLRELLSGHRIEPGLCNKLFRKELFQGWTMDNSIRINEDLLMNFYLFSNADTSVFDDWCPYHYIVRSTSASRAKVNSHKIYDPIRVKDIIRKAASMEICEDAQQAYINTCINAYHMLLGEREYQSDLLKVRALLNQESKHFSLLGTKRALMGWLIVKLPMLYKPIYGFYSLFFQKNVYS